MKRPFAEVAEGVAHNGAGEGSPVAWAELICEGQRMVIVLHSEAGSTGGSNALPRLSGSCLIRVACSEQAWSHCQLTSPTPIWQRAGPGD